MARSRLTATSVSQIQEILLPQPAKWLGLQACAITLANFVFLVEMGFLHVGQAGFELPTSGDPPASVSQSAGITGMSHSARQFFIIKNSVSCMKLLSKNFQKHSKQDCSS